MKRFLATFSGGFTGEDEIVEFLSLDMESALKRAQQVRKNDEATLTRISDDSGDSVDLVTQLSELYPPRSCRLFLGTATGSLLIEEHLSALTYEMAVDLACIIWPNWSLLGLQAGDATFRIRVPLHKLDSSNTTRYPNDL